MPAHPSSTNCDGDGDGDGDPSIKQHTTEATNPDQPTIAGNFNSPNQPKQTRKSHFPSEARAMINPDDNDGSLNACCYRGCPKPCGLESQTPSEIASLASNLAGRSQVYKAGWSPFSPSFFSLLLNPSSHTSSTYILYIHPSQTSFTNILQVSKDTTLFTTMISPQHITKNNTPTQDGTS
ncbi:hypothetical protein LZ32DRAFT_255365 [Colletotrichum eremochloae]|nr:hypothetical protein LZ32DRAFT_255365 [Colletotrichum eremochloae]